MLCEDLPSDYEDETDESDEEEIINMDIKDNESTLVLDNVAIIVIGDEVNEIHEPLDKHDSKTRLIQEDILDDNENRKLRKKPEPAIDTSLINFPKKKK